MEWARVFLARRMKTLHPAEQWVLYWKYISQDSDDPENDEDVADRLRELGAWIEEPCRGRLCRNRKPVASDVPQLEVQALETLRDHIDRNFPVEEEEACCYEVLSGGRLN
jgi:hypothetical protein